MKSPLGAHVGPSATRFAVRAPLADAVELCLFDGDVETRLAMEREGENWIWELPGDLSGCTYGYRAHGTYAPERQLWFDPAKLLVDPYAAELDRRFVQEPRLAQFGVDTADIVPRAIVPKLLEPVPPEPPHFERGGLVYELNVRAFTMLHPDVPAALRGTVAALAHPAVLAHLRRLHVSAIELMPITAWIDERHLPPLGLVNAWGYNPVAFMALDPGLCPGGVAELRDTAAKLHEAGIGVILDLVFNHSGESDTHGGTISLRGLDPQAYATDDEGRLINDTGCGNTLDFANRHVRALTVASLRHFAAHCGIGGFRFDLAPILARGPGFDADAPIFAEIAADPILADRVMIAEPWDIGPGGYQLGQFPPNWLEWNDRYRDDVRRFWRGDASPGDLATRIAGSADIFGTNLRGVSFLAAHDGFTLADTVAYEQRHNQANGEDNRDGHGENFSWNCGVEGPSDDPAVVSVRADYLRALLGTLFATSGTIMLTAGDEFGRSQRGNNNAYCQDNAIGWIDWEGRDLALEDHVAGLASARAARAGTLGSFPPDSRWHDLSGSEMRSEMRSQMWEDSGFPGFQLTAPYEPGTFTLHIDRAARRVAADFSVHGAVWDCITLKSASYKDRA